MGISRTTESKHAVDLIADKWKKLINLDESSGALKKADFSMYALLIAIDRQIKSIYEDGKLKTGINTDDLGRVKQQLDEYLNNQILPKTIRSHIAKISEKLGNIDTKYGGDISKSKNLVGHLAAVMAYCDKALPKLAADIQAKDIKMTAQYVAFLSSQKITNKDDFAGHFKAMIKICLAEINRVNPSLYFLDSNKVSKPIARLLNDMFEFDALKPNQYQKLEGNQFYRKTYEGMLDELVNALKNINSDGVNDKSIKTLTQSTVNFQKSFNSKYKSFNKQQSDLGVKPVTPPMESRPSQVAAAAGRKSYDSFSESSSSSRSRSSSFSSDSSLSSRSDDVDFEEDEEERKLAKEGPPSRPAPPAPLTRTSSAFFKPEAGGSSGEVKIHDPKITPKN